MTLFQIKSLGLIDEAPFNRVYEYECTIDNRSAGRWEFATRDGGPVRLRDLRKQIQKMKAIYSSFNCLDCGVNTSAIDEYYMVYDEVWLEANPVDCGMLCIVCLEKRLGRLLTAKDFTGYPINSEFNKSELLKARMTCNHSPDLERH